MGRSTTKIAVLTANTTNNNTGMHKMVTIVMLAISLWFSFSPGNHFLIAAQQTWPGPWSEVITYTLTTFLICWERKRLALFHLDGFALGLFILARPLESLYLTLVRNVESGMVFPSPFSLAGCVSALLLALVLWSQHKTIPGLSRKSLGWLLIGLVVGILMSIGLGWVLSCTFSADDILIHPSLERVTRQTLVVFLVLLGQQVVVEEVLLRGFLWGLLNQVGLKNWLIWLLQAVMAMFGSIVLIKSTPLVFWIVVPFTSLTLGALTWRTRSVAASMLARGVMVGLIYWSAYLFAAGRF